MRAKLNDLYDIYPGKWVLFNKGDWKNGRTDTCELHGVYDTEEEGDAGLFKMERLDNYEFMLNMTSPKEKEMQLCEQN
ncbi:MAG: hypothetical protein FWG68_09070 [Defluviitaleaceae bacterium]|nr:hypothetical protein [Defluviitaleaceae bacterium]